MTAGRLPGLAIAACLASVSAAASESRWPDQLAGSLAGLRDPTSVSLPAALGPAISFAAGPCRTSNLPTSGSEAPVASAVLVYADERSCEAPTPLVMLQLYVDAKSVADIDRLKRKLAGLLPAPCFSGREPSDPRRHAPAHELVAWKLEGRSISLGQDAGHGSAVGISFVNTAVRPDDMNGQGRGDKALIDGFVASLPAACR